MTFKKNILLILFLFFTFNAEAQLYRIKTKDTCNVGLFITSLHDFNMAEESFTADFWLWFNYKNDSLHLLETREIANSKSVESTIQDSEKKGNVNWSSEKIRAVLKHYWQLENFPFDKQELEIEIEEAIYNTSAMIYLPDKINSKYDANNIALKGWEITGFAIEPNIKTYQTTYGDPALTGKSAYPSVKAKITLERVAGGLFYKLFTGVYVSFLITMMVFFIDPIEVDPRFGLSVGGLFASVGNKYIVDSILPETSSFTLIDKVHAITFFYILLSVVLSAFSLHLSKTNRTDLSRKSDKISFIAFTSSYLIINFWLIADAAFN